MRVKQSRSLADVRSLIIGRIGLAPVAPFMRSGSSTVQGIRTGSSSKKATPGATDWVLSGLFYRPGKDSSTSRLDYSLGIIGGYPLFLRKGKLLSVKTHYLK